MEQIFGSILGITIIIFILFILPISMAKKRGRNPVGWTILFWILTPFWGAILLLILGDSKKKIKQDILDEINNNQHPPTYE
ncbi:MAG: hypothetical protein IKA19_04765 [Muribaculaceae bacterium]|nr:hypothetical protein [Muribaculaceae bacterium]